VKLPLPKISTPLIAILVIAFPITFYGGFVLGTKNVRQEDLVTVLKNKSPEQNILTSDDASTVDFSPFWKTWRILDENFVPVSHNATDMVDTNTKVVKAIQGLVSSYGDPYTVFFNEEETKNFTEKVTGTFEGIGAVLKVGDTYPVVAQVLPNAPAAKAHIIEGDTLVAVDGVTTQSLPIQTVIDMIRGKSSTDVYLTVRHPKEQKPRIIKVTRESISLPATNDIKPSVLKRIIANVREALSGVEKQDISTKDFFVFGLSNFSGTSQASFKTEMEKFKASGTRNLIIDLRNNGGGYIDAAVDIASYFLPKDALVVTEKRGKDKREQEITYMSKGYPLLTDIHDIKVVILVNRNTASAAEILSAALREHNIAVLVGEKTFGKGSVQEFLHITDSLSLKVTVARWYTPHGVSLSGNGLDPDYVVVPTLENSGNGRDPVLEKAIEVVLMGKESSF
jgi:carboxyl-terminal processing protease